MRGDKVILLATGEGGVLVSGWDSQDRNMVEITYSRDANRWALIVFVQREDVRPATEDEAEHIPDQPPFLFDLPDDWMRHWVER